MELCLFGQWNGTFDRQGLDREVPSGNAVNPSMEAAAKTSCF